MATFDDVYDKYEEIFDKYTRLRILLVKKLKKQKVDADFGNLSFEKLIHLVDTIPTKEYDIIENDKPSSNDNVDIYSFATHMNDNKVITDVSLSNFNEALFSQTWYYIKLLRYYLAAKGVDLSKLNSAYTLQEHILLIDFLPRIKSTILNVTLNYNEYPDLYYGHNVFNIYLSDEDGNIITEGGRIHFYNDGLRKVQPISDKIEIDVNDLNRHSYKFQYINQEGDYINSNIVEFIDLQVQPMPIVFNASLSNSINREYIDTTDSLKGFINDTWYSYTTTYDIHYNSINLPITIQIDDLNRKIYTESFDSNTIQFLLHNNENNNEPIHVSLSPNNSIYYIFNKNIIDFYVNILYPIWDINPEYDYTGKESYQFEITFYNEFTGALTHDYDDLSANIIFQLHSDDVIINDDFLVNNGKIIITHNNNLRINNYTIQWTINDIIREDVIKILPNIEYPDDIIYLNDEPEIKIINNINIDALIIAITPDYELEEYDVFFDPDNINGMMHYILDIDENGYIILPNEYKQVGTYCVRMENNETGEEFEFSYTIMEPYTYYMEQSSDRVIFYINVNDEPDFDYNNITDYIKIYEYETELEYQYSRNNDGQITIIADKNINPDFKGFNTFCININNYIQTENFTLRGIDEPIFEILTELNLGNNEIDIACYDGNIHRIFVTITSNDNIILDSYQIDSDDEDFIFNQYFEESGYYNFIITDNNITEQYTIYVGKKVIALQDFKFKDRIALNDSGNNNAYLGFGFAEGNEIADDITVIFYCDTPQNILTTKIINVANTEYITYNDIFLGDATQGEHTIYASFAGNENYQSFLLSKTFNRLMDTTIIYDREINTIDEGDYITLSLLTIDTQKNIVNKGHYVINNVTYNLDDEITLVPRSAGNYNVRIQYIGEDEYADATINISYRINEGQYDYYASSLLGDNNNAGISPYAPVQDIETLLSISGVNDRLCLMEGEYNHDTLLRNAKFYGYNKHRIENIKLNINRIGPNIELSLKNLSVNTGGGYVNITDMHTFFNNSNEYVMLKATPGEHDEPVWFEDVYEILMNDEIIFNSDTNTISGIIHKNGNPIGEKLIKVYCGDEIVRATMSNNNGEFEFNFTTNEDVQLLIVTDKCDKTINIIRNMS